jgi:hypothetical protein
MLQELKMRKFVSCIILLFIVTSAYSQVKVFFPPESLTDNQNGHERLSKRFKKILLSMNEMSIYRQKGYSQFKLRILWLRTFDEPVSITIFERDKDAFVRIAVLNGRGGYWPGVLKYRKNYKLEYDMYNQMKVLIDDIILELILGCYSFLTIGFYISRSINFFIILQASYTIGFLVAISLVCVE